MDKNSGGEGSGEMNSDAPNHAAPLITRRTAVAGIAGVAALAILPGCNSTGSGGGAIEGKPNFIYIMADDLGYADLSCYGRRDYETPVLDRLASEGMMFMSAYANSAVCTATRVGLATGRYQYRLPIGLQEPGGGAEMGLAPEHPTIASLMRAAGYKTTLVGKWHMGLLPKFGPLQSGYDEFWGMRGGGVDYFRHGFGTAKDLWDGDVPVEATGYMTDLLADATIKTLERRAEDKQPFMISLHFTAPHWPWEGNDEAGKAESGRATASGLDNAFGYDSGTLETYAAMMKSLDDNIGRVLEKLKELGLDGNTVVIFTSDNGGERFSDTWPFSGKKTELLEGGIRVPAIVKWPGVTTPGSRSDVPIMSMDWLPTFVAAGGGKTDAAYPPDGVDILPALKGEAMAERSLYWRFNNKGQEAHRKGDWKYLKIDGNEFLFNVIEDPLERGNLKDRNPDKFAELKGEFGQWNSTMLYDPNAPSYGFTGQMLADHFGN
jgi:arylsulfatase A-like enzyme